jgi:CelD/BcsL family acetyltransferase involved in cellulose biosynthesis
VPHRVGFACGPDGAPRGAVVVARGTRRRGGVPLRTAHVGTAGEPRPDGVEAPYGRLVCAPGDRPAVAAALVGALEAEPGWDLVLAERLHPDDAAALLRAAPRWSGAPEPSPTADLAPVGPAGDALAALPARTRGQVRRALREHGPLVVEVADGPGAAHDVLDELARLHGLRFRPGAFARPRFHAFHRDLVDALVPDGRMLLVRVRADGRTVGCVTVLRDGDRALSYTGGMAAPRGPRDKPGFLVHASAMGVCAERGMGEYDLLTGAAPYKLELGRAPREQWTLRAQRLGPRVLAGSATRGVRRAIGRGPVRPGSGA